MQSLLHMPTPSTRPHNYPAPLPGSVPGADADAPAIAMKSLGSQGLLHTAISSLCLECAEHFVDLRKSGGIQQRETETAGQRTWGGRGVGVDLRHMLVTWLCLNNPSQTSAPTFPSFVPPTHNASFSTNPPDQPGGWLVPETQPLCWMP